ncbi:30S ribosomal protein S11 [Cupriavidus basilensis]
MAKGPNNAARARKKVKKNVADGIAHVHASFSNTIITITDRQGNALSWATAGGQGRQGSSRKSTPFAAQGCCRERRPCGTRPGHQEPGSAHQGSGARVAESAVRALNALGIKIAITEDVTPIPHNGRRPPKRRRI